MKRQTLIILFGVLIIFAGFLPAADFNKEFKQSYDFTPGGLLKVKSYKGSLDIQEWNKSEVSVKAVIEAPEDLDPEYAKKIVEATEIEIRQEKGLLYIRSNYDKVPERGFLKGKTLPYVHYTIKAPRELNMNINDHKSKVDLGSFTGDLKLKSYKGRLFLKELTGNLNLDSYKGEGTLYVKEGSIIIDSYKGDFETTLAKVKGDCEIDSYKGDIDFKLSKGQAVSVIKKRNKKGRIRVNVKEGNGYKIVVKTYKGDINITN